MNILHVVNISFVIPYFLGEQLNYFSDKGYKEFIICSPSSELELFASNYSFKYCEVEITRKISIVKDIKAIISIIKYIRNNNIDIIIGHTPKGALLGIVSGFICKIPKRIYFRHGLVYETAKGINRLLLKNIDRLTALLSTKIICVSNSVYKKSIIDKLNNQKKQLVLSLGTCNGIDTNRFSIEKIDKNAINTLKKQYRINKNDFIIGFTGRLVKDKGIIELVLAFQKLQKKYNNIKLLLVGRLEERDALPKNIIDIININENIITTGYVLNSEIEYFYSLMDVFILPSYREGFPTSVLEASSMKLPVITTRATGCIDSIIEKETGYFVNHSVNELFKIIELLYHDPHERLKMGENGRKFVVNYYNQKIIWNEIEKLYLSD